MTDKQAEGERLCILVVEDEASAANPVKAVLEETLGAKVVIAADFKAGLDELVSNKSVDALVLDLYAGNIHEPMFLEGEAIWNHIWSDRFVPIAIHTAAPAFELDPPVPPDNPFIRAFTKGPTSHGELARFLTDLAPFLHEIRKVSSSIDRATSRALRDSSTAIWRATAGNEQARLQLIAATARRRVAALFDEGMSGRPVDSSEQYVYPPIAESLMTGDILRGLSGSPDDPTAYRLVLSPSCDLQMRDGECGLADVLVSNCVSFEEFVKTAPTTRQLNLNKLRERLPSLLTQPHVDGYIVLPAFGNILPCMAADLRRLELISHGEISPSGNGDRKWSRVASIDSPFRELLVWAYLLVAGRPGVPDRDFAGTLGMVAPASGAEE